VLHLIGADQLDDVVSITVDRRWRIRRYGDALVNETKLDTQTLYWLGTEGMALCVLSTGIERKGLRWSFWTKRSYATKPKSLRYCIGLL